MIRRLRREIVGMLLCLLPVSAMCRVLDVPESFATVQMALDSTASGDTVLVSPGTYIEALVVPDRDVTLAGRYLVTGDTTDISECVLKAPPDMARSRTIVALQGDSLRTLNIVGFRIRAFFLADTFAYGGILLVNRNTVIRRCIIDSLRADPGAAVQARNGTLEISDCRIHHVGSRIGLGAALDLHSVEATVRRTEFAEFFATPEMELQIVSVSGGTTTFAGCLIHNSGAEREFGRPFLAANGAHAAVSVIGCEITGCRFHNSSATAQERRHFGSTRTMCMRTRFSLISSSTMWRIQAPRLSRRETSL
jgi:hypothetical protein